jgi:hypothetical protein
MMSCTEEVKRKIGRPIGGKSDPSLREYWRVQGAKARARKKQKKVEA